MLGQGLEILRDRRHNGLVVDEGTARARGCAAFPEILDPVMDGLQIGLGDGRHLKIRLVVQIVRHFLVGELIEELRTIGIAGQHQVRRLGHLVEHQHIAEILGRRLTLRQLAVLVASRAMLVENVEGQLRDRIGRNGNFGRNRRPGRHGNQSRQQNACKYRLK